MYKHEHSHCHHELKYCSICDVVYCSKCGREWKRDCSWTYINSVDKMPLWARAGDTAGTWPLRSPDTVYCSNNGDLSILNTISDKNGSGTNNHKHPDLHKGEKTMDTGIEDMH